MIHFAGEPSAKQQKMIHDALSYKKQQSSSSHRDSGPSKL